MTNPPEVPRGALTPAALGIWFTAFKIWSREIHGRMATAEAALGVEAPAAEAPAVLDGTDFSSYRHKAGNSSLSTWNLANVVGAADINTFGTPAADTLYAFPVVAPKRGGTLAKLAWESNAGSGNGRMALYSNKAADNLYPDALLVDGGTVANGGAGVVNSATVSVALTAGALYWVVINSTGTANMIRVLAASAFSSILGWEMGTTPSRIGISKAQAFGAMPNPFPSGGAYILSSGGFIPALAYRID